MSGRKARSVSVPNKTWAIEHTQKNRRFTIIETFVCAKSEAIVVNGEIVVTIIDILDDEVVFAVEAPDWVEVFAEEASDGAEMMERAGISDRSP